MNLHEAHILVNELKKEHGLNDWGFKWNNAKTILGKCNYTTRTILLSKYYTLKRSEILVRNTILHEIAHALVGSYHSHDKVWRKKAIEIGCNGKKSCNSGIDHDYKYQAICPQCKYVHKRHRIIKKDTSCGACSTKYNPDTLLTWIDQRIKQSKSSIIFN